MPIHSAVSFLEHADPCRLLVGGLVVGALGFLKVWSGGRKCTWERDWAGKMILIVAPPTPTILSLIDYLLNLPRPPQILFLPPYPSPLPDTLLTLLHTIRLSITNPLAQLHCEPLPFTPRGIREFIARWGKVSTGMTGEGGRRIDAIILGGGWEVPSPSSAPPASALDEVDVKQEKKWTLHEYHFHFLTSLIPQLLRQPPERNIRIVSLVSPTYSSALPTLLGKPAKTNSTVQISGAKSITTMLLMQHVQLILDLLSAAALNQVKEVPDPDGVVKRRQQGVQSNVMSVSVIMPWAREEVVRGTLGVDQTWWKWLLWVLLYPLVMFMTPSPRRTIQSILFALQAPVRYGPVCAPLRPTAISTDPTDSSEPTKESKAQDEDKDGLSWDPRRNAVGAGDVVRNCALGDLPPVLSDPALAKVTYEALEKAVEKGVKDDALREKVASQPAAGQS